jgi:hypothetical protein
VATTGAARAKERELPQSATITIHNYAPKPQGEVEVTPRNGKIHFKNKDKRSYRLRFFRKNTEFSSGIDILLPAEGIVTVLIKEHDEWNYFLSHGGDPMNGTGGGPIKN